MPLAAVTDGGLLASQRTGAGASQTPEPPAHPLQQQQQPLPPAEAAAAALDGLQALAPAAEEEAAVARIAALALALGPSDCHSPLLLPALSCCSKQDVDSSTASAQPGASRRLAGLCMLLQSLASPVLQSAPATALIICLAQQTVAWLTAAVHGQQPAGAAVPEVMPVLLHALLSSCACLVAQPHAAAQLQTVWQPVQELLQV